MTKFLSILCLPSHIFTTQTEIDYYLILFMLLSLERLKISNKSKIIN